MRNRLFAVPVVLFALGACGTGRELGADIRADSLSSNGVNATLTLQSDWGSGYCAEVAVQNAGSVAATAWTAVIELHQSTLSQIWSATATQSGSRISVKPVSWNSSIAPGASVAFGFCGNGSGSSARPELVSLAVTGGSGGGGGGGTTSYTLDIAVSGNGSSNPAAGSHTYASGTAVQVTAIPASGATFTGWSGAASGTTNPVMVAMNGNTTLTANFSGGGGDLPSSCPGTCNAATPVYPTLSSNGGLGNVTMYSTSASSGGACNYGTTNVMYYAAMSVNVQPGDGKGQWQSGRICGQCAEVTVLTSQGPKSVVVRIMDKCADAYCGIDLGGSAPSAVMLNGSGRYDGKWRFVSCSGHPEASDGSPSLAVISGSNPWWARVRVRNPTTAVASIGWQSASGTASGSFPYATDPENAFEVPVNEVLQSASPSFRITVRYVDGSTATTQLSPGQLAAQNSSYPLN